MDHLTEDIPKQLLAAGIINNAAHAKALQQQKNLGGSLMASLVKVGAITDDALLDFLSRLYSVPAVDLKHYEPDPALTKLIPGDVATKFQALPIAQIGRAHV